jgi:hypothetical protein
MKRFDFAFKVLEKAAGYEEQLHKPKATIEITPEEAQTHSRLRSEYFVIRTALVGIFGSLISSGLIDSSRHGGKTSSKSPNLCLRKLPFKNEI